MSSALGIVTTLWPLHPHLETEGKENRPHRDIIPGHPQNTFHDVFTVFLPPARGAGRDPGAGSPGNASAGPRAIVGKSDSGEHNLYSVLAFH